MIAILGSLVLVLYVFLPDFLFNTLAFNFRKVNRVQTGRYTDLLAGGAVNIFPFLFATLLSRTIWFFGHWPFPVQQDAASKYADYRTLATALYSETFFREHVAATWSAWSHIHRHQERFLVWMYAGLGLQILGAILLTRYFGSLSRYPWYRKTLGRFFLRRASHWEVLLTGFAFPHKHRPAVAIDALTADNHLYAGTVADFFLRTDGELSGLLLTDFSRFKFTQLEADRKAGLNPDSSNYWKRIPGANFYLPADKIANLNIRYETPDSELLEDVEEWMKNLDPGSAIKVTFEADSPSAVAEPPEFRPETPQQPDQDPGISS
ncbi:MAG: hypothetical protein NVSMB62_27150 [Acidobacteriaceae bacterium]